MQTLEVFLADPIVTDLTLPAFDIRKMRLVYCLEMTDAEDEQLLEQTFRALNINHPANYHERSLSVGDVVTIAGTRSYRCDWVGWQRLERPLLFLDRDSVSRSQTFIPG